MRRFAGLLEGEIGNEGRLRFAPEAAARVAIGLRWRVQFLEFLDDAGSAWRIGL